MKQIAMLNFINQPYLVERQETSLASEFAGFARSFWLGIESVTIRIFKSERLPVCRHAHDDFWWVSTKFYPIVEREIGVEVLVADLRMGI